MSYITYRAIQNQTRRSINYSKNQYFKQKFTNSKSSKERWKFISAITPKCPKQKILSIKAQDGSIAKDEKNIADILNSSFCSLKGNNDHQIIDIHCTGNINSFFMKKPIQKKL